MPRPLRITLPNIPFHILNRGNNRQIVFKEEKDFIYFLKLLRRYKKELKFKIYHFCLMPNHTHFVIEPTIEGSLSKIMLRLTLAYTWYFNKKYNAVGHVWQGRYKSSLLDKEDYFIWCGLYNELNPVRAGLAARPEEWRWSSYRFYALEESNHLMDGLIDVDPYYLELGNDHLERQKRYKEGMEGVVGEEFLRNIRKQLDEGVYGGAEFVREMKEKFKIKSLMSSGRPRKGEK